MVRRHLWSLSRTAFMHPRERPYAAARVREHASSARSPLGPAAWGMPRIIAIPLTATQTANSCENPRNFGKIRLHRVNISPQSPWDPAAMARHRKPAVIRKLEGNPGKRPIPNEIPGLGKPVIPAHLSLDEQACW